MSVYTSLLALLLCTTIMMGADGDTDHAEQVRRAVEGGVDTPEEIAAVEATIAAKKPSPCTAWPAAKSPYQALWQAEMIQSVDKITLPGLARNDRV